MSHENVIKNNREKRNIHKLFQKGKNKKRSRSEMFRQQEIADARFFKMEEERFDKELEIEQKRRREEMQHQTSMMQMMGNMLSQFSSSIHYGQRPYQCILKTGPYFIAIRAPSRMKKGLQAVEKTLHQEVKNQLTALTILHCKCIYYYESSWQSFQP